MNSSIINFICPFIEVYYSPNWSDPLVLVSCMNLPALLPGYFFRKRSSSHSIFQPRTVKLPNNTTYYSCLLLFDGCPSELKPLKCYSFHSVFHEIRPSEVCFGYTLLFCSGYNCTQNSGWWLFSKTLFLLVIPCISSHTLSFYYSICIYIWNIDARLWS